jgi:thiazole synthase
MSQPDSPLVLAGRSFSSRLIVGTGRYADFPTMKAALLASGAEMVTVAVRRLDLKAEGEASLLHWIPEGMVLLPNTAGCFTADDAVRTATVTISAPLARSAAFMVGKSA